ncbi:hypothetical protein WJX75_005011 [Coccomyxa subellipsoidea]|uniref:Pseudouridine synthase I TruA alpha/beta domain-containing protein n=1 Tax=Coccomyxa subellipsoidea TaxID=248742 RepID=A0ABR2Z3P3_9CHLO
MQELDKSSFQGLQLQRGVEDITTIEAALEDAIGKAGGILESNRGALHKIDWSRSSRTDKGVHSCSTVIGLKMECVVDSFETDPEGLSIAAEINKHLPRQVRVLSVQRTNQKFDARQICEGRVYSYFLPTYIIGLQLDGSEEDRERLRLLRECLALFEGVHAFHNFTKRRLYRASQRQIGRRGKEKSGSRAIAGREGALEEGDASSGEEGDGGVDASVALEAASVSSDWRTDRGPRLLQMKWNEERDDADPITRSHFRHIYSATADDPVPLVPDGTPCIKVVFSGQSFMLHQIRHMVGAAVAVARRAIPLEFVEACLRSPSRAIMPLAPPHVLVLSATVMMKWRDEQAKAMLAHMTGDRLALRSGGRAAQEVFLSEVLHTAINDLLQVQDWEYWEAMLQRIAYDEAEMEAFLVMHAQSKARLEQHRADKQAFEAAAPAEVTQDFDHAGKEAKFLGGHLEEKRHDPLSSPTPVTPRPKQMGQETAEDPESTLQPPEVNPSDSQKYTRSSAARSTPTKSSSEASFSPVNATHRGPRLSPGSSTSQSKLRSPEREASPGSASEGVPASLQGGQEQSEGQQAAEKMHLKTEEIDGVEYTYYQEDMDEVEKMSHEECIRYIEEQEEKMRQRNEKQCMMLQALSLMWSFGLECE